MAIAPAGHPRRAPRSLPSHPPPGCPKLRTPSRPGGGRNALASLLTDADPSVRRESAVALGRTGSRQAIEPLLAALGDPDRFASWSIRSATRQLGYPARDAMREALLDPRRRESALNLADESWCVPVIEALVDAEVDQGARRSRGWWPRWRASIGSIPSGRAPGGGPIPCVGAFPRKTANWDASGMQAVLEGLRQGSPTAMPRSGSRRSSRSATLVRRPAPILRAGFAAESDHGTEERLSRLWVPPLTGTRCGY